MLTIPLSIYYFKGALSKNIAVLKRIESQFEKVSASISGVNSCFIDLQYNLYEELLITQSDFKSQCKGLKPFRLQSLNYIKIIFIKNYD